MLHSTMFLHDPICFTCFILSHCVRGHPKACTNSTLFQRTSGVTSSPLAYGLYTCENVDIFGRPLNVPKFYYHYVPHLYVFLFNCFSIFSYLHIFPITRVFLIMLLF